MPLNPHPSTAGSGLVSPHLPRGKLAELVVSHYVWQNQSPSPALPNSEAQLCTPSVRGPALEKDLDPHPAWLQFYFGENPALSGPVSSPVT